jgi:methionyl-tRNA formyltransferase
MLPRVIYMGTPDFAVPALERLAANGHCELALVVTQPDRPAGRGKKLVSPAVKITADELGLPTVQTTTLRDPDVRQQIIDLKPDLIIVAAFGMILGKWILELPVRGCVNLHASLLPRYRGASPIASAIAEGEDVTGVSLMLMDRGLDTGPVYATTRIAIEDDDTTELLTPKLATAAGDLLEDNLQALLNGSMEAVPQGAGATLTRMMTKADGWIDFSKPAIAIERHIRAMWPWPRAWTTNDEHVRIQVHAADVSAEAVGAPGLISRRGNGVHVGTGGGSLVLRRILLPGGKPLEDSAITQSVALVEGNVLGVAEQQSTQPPLVQPVEEAY